MMSQALAFIDPDNRVGVAYVDCDQHGVVGFSGSATQKVPASSLSYTAWMRVG
jgi:hypothetical protein